MEQGLVLVLPGSASKSRRHFQSVAKDRGRVFLFAELELGQGDRVFGFEPELTARLRAGEDAPPLVERLFYRVCVAGKEQLGVAFLNGSAIGVLLGESGEGGHGFGPLAGRGQRFGTDASEGK